MRGSKELTGKRHNSRLMSRIKLILGLGIAMAGLIIILTTPDKLGLAGFMILGSIYSPLGFHILPWQLYITPVLLALGTYLALSAKRSSRTLTVVLITWILTYLVYMTLLWYIGHPLWFEAFHFGKLRDLPFLILLSVFVGLVLRLQWDVSVNVDTNGLLIALTVYLVSIVSGTIAKQAGPGAQFDGRKLAFILLWPSYIAIALTAISLIFKVVYSVWWEIGSGAPRLVDPVRQQSPLRVFIATISILLLAISGYVLTIDNAPVLSFSTQADDPIVDMREPSIGTQMVTPQPEELQMDKNIILQEFYAASCRDVAGGTTDRSWIAATLMNEDHKHWAKISGKLNFINTDGDVIRAIPVDDLVIASQTTSWFVPLETLQQAKSVAIGVYEHVELSVTEVEWSKLDGSEESYSLASKLLDHNTSESHFPRHTLTIAVTNTGKKTLYRTRAFAVILNSKYELVDLLYSEPVRTWTTGRRIRPGKRVVIEMSSLSHTGACLGPADSNGYEILYWVNAITGVGQPLGIQGSMQSP